MMINRIGTFLILVGLLLIGLFAISDMGQTPVCSLLIFGGLSLGIGVFLWFRNPSSPAQPTGRFRIFRSPEKKPDDKK